MMYNFEESKGGGDVRDRQSTGSPVAWMSPPSSRYILFPDRFVLACFSGAGRRPYWNTACSIQAGTVSNNMNAGKDLGVLLTQLACFW